MEAVKKQLIIIILLFLLIGSLFIGTTSAADGDLALAQQYAPILYFVADEKCYPVDVSYFIDNSFLYQQGNPIPISEQPTADMIATFTSTTEIYYLDNQLGTVNEGDDGIETAYQSQMSTNYKIYARVDNAQGIIQYWFFYVFNNGDLNRHEGDWEMIQIYLYNGEPAQVMCSQHHGGQRAVWAQVDRDGDHPRIYVARGSHANYLRSYSGKLGIASDVVGNNGKTIQTADYLEILTTQPWLSFAGHWGWVGESDAAAVESSVLGNAGPEGPQFREDGLMWTSPLSWGAGLFQTNDMMFLAEWLLYNFVMIFLICVVIAVLVLAFRLYRRYKRHGLGPRFFAFLYIDGFNSKSIGNILCMVGVVIAFLGLFYPWYTVTTTITIPDYATQGTMNMITIDGIHGFQVTLPNSNGPTPLGNFALPFSTLVGIGLIFLILGSIGLSKSRKAGIKYLGRGIGLLLPFIIIIIVLMSLGAILPLLAPSNLPADFNVFQTINTISSSPFNGQQTVTLADVSGSVSLEWGFGVGIYLMLIAAIILIMAGLLEIVAHASFFDEREWVPLPKVKKEKEPKKPKPPKEKDIFPTEEEVKK